MPLLDQLFAGLLDPGNANPELMQQLWRGAQTPTPDVAAGGRMNAVSTPASVILPKPTVKTPVLPSREVLPLLKSPPGSQNSPVTASSVEPVGGAPQAQMPASASPGVLQTHPDFSSMNGPDFGAILRGLGLNQGLIDGLGIGGNDRAQMAELAYGELVKQGYEPKTAEFYVRNPKMLGNILPQVMKNSQGAQRELTEVYDENSGRKRKALVDPRTGAIQYVGGAEGQNAEDRTKGAPTGYVWKDPSNPAAGLAPIEGYKDQGDVTLSREQAKEAAARVKRYNNEADVARDALSDVAQLRELRKGVSYEGVPFAGPIATGLGYIGSGNGQAVRSKATELQLSFTNSTKGAISDREMALFSGATPGIDMPDDAAEKVFIGMEAGAERVKERAKFFETWLNTHKNMTGAQESWDQFVTDKPILIGDGKGNLKVNRTNVGAWRDYVTGKQGGSSDVAAKAEIPAGAMPSIQSFMKPAESSPPSALPSGWSYKGAR